MSATEHYANTSQNSMRISSHHLQRRSFAQQTNRLEQGHVQIHLSTVEKILPSWFYTLLRRAICAVEPRETILPEFMLFTTVSDKNAVQTKFFNAMTPYKLSFRNMLLAKTIKRKNYYTYSMLYQYNILT